MLRLVISIYYGAGLGTLLVNKALRLSLIYSLGIASLDSLEELHGNPQRVYHTPSQKKVSTPYLFNSSAPF